MHKTNGYQVTYLLYNREYIRITLKKHPLAITLVFTRPIYQIYVIDEYHLKAMAHIFTLNDSRCEAHRDMALIIYL